MRELRALSRKRWSRPLAEERIEAIVFLTVGNQCALWESLLPEEMRRLPHELGRVDSLLDHPAFFAPVRPPRRQRTHRSPSTVDWKHCDATPSDSATYRYGYGHDATTNEMVSPATSEAPPSINRAGDELTTPLGVCPRGQTTEGE
jgi:hypothetical protein